MESRHDAGKQEDGAPGLNAPSFDRVFQLGLRHTPLVTKLSIGALVVLSIAIVLLRSAASTQATVFASVWVITLGILSAVASQVLKSRSRGILGDVLAWTIVALFCSSAILVVSSLLLGFPERSALIIARVAKEPSLLPISRSSEESRISTTSRIGDLGPSLLEWQDPPSDEIDFQYALRKRPALILEPGATLLMMHDEHLTIYVSRLTLRDARIVTNGGDLTVVAGAIVSSNGSIVSFPAPLESTLANEGNDGGTVRLKVYGSLNGQMSIDLRGQSGASGAPGLDGASGGQGRQGDPAASGLFDCKRGPGNGRGGDPGQPGQPGQPGFDGGRGGLLFVESNSVELASAFVIFRAEGGEGGLGGAGGNGGPGGPGGPGGTATGLCSGRGAPGPQGPPGPRGEIGSPGRSGAAGSFSNTLLSKDGDGR